jgi:hypothetical protein
MTNLTKHTRRQAQKEDKLVAQLQQPFPIDQNTARHHLWAQYDTMIQTKADAGYLDNILEVQHNGPTED